VNTGKLPVLAFDFQRDGRNWESVSLHKENALKMIAGQMVHNGTSIPKTSAISDS
jgi:hypothetical protein